MDTPKNDCAPPPDLPPGTIMPFAGKHTPPGWLACDGAPLERGDYRYENLYQAIGRDWTRSTDEKTIFRVPNLGTMPLPQANLAWAVGFPPCQNDNGDGEHWVSGIIKYIIRC